MNEIMFLLLIFLPISILSAIPSFLLSLRLNNWLKKIEIPVKIIVSSSVVISILTAYFIIGLNKDSDYIFIAQQMLILNLLFTGVLVGKYIVYKSI